jgi:hypothetical protein
MGDPFKRLRGQSVVIHLSGGGTLAGTVYDSWQGVLELRGGLEIVGSRTVALDGGTCIPHRQIDYFQVGVELPTHSVRAAA